MTDDLVRRVSGGVPATVARTGIHHRTEDLFLTLFDCIDEQRTLVGTLEKLLPDLGRIHAIPASPGADSSILPIPAPDAEVRGAAESFDTFRADTQAYLHFLKRSMRFPLEMDKIPRYHPDRTPGYLVMLQGMEKHYAAFVSTGKGSSHERELIQLSAQRKGISTVGELEKFSHRQPVVIIIYATSEERVDSIEEGAALQVQLESRAFCQSKHPELKPGTSTYFLTPSLGISLIKLNYGKKNHRYQSSMITERIYCGSTEHVKGVYLPPELAGCAPKGRFHTFNGENPAQFNHWLSEQPPQDRSLVRQYTKALDKLQTAANKTLHSLRAREEQYRQIMESPDRGIEAAATNELDSLLDL